MCVYVCVLYFTVYFLLWATVKNIRKMVRSDLTLAMALTSK